MKYVDLHSHSCLSDGYYQPKELPLLAKEAGLSAFALTDHDCIDGLSVAKEMANNIGIEFISGVEISSIDIPTNKTVHVLGLFLKDIEKLSPIISELKQKRLNASLIDAKKYNEKFGLNITKDDLEKCNFLHKVIVDKGYAADYPGRAHMKSQIQHEKFGADVYDAIKSIHMAGGISIIAHPCLLNLDEKELYAFISKYKEAGLDGLECFHTRHKKEQSELYLKIADDLGLIVSGGSDFHGKYKPDEFFGKGKNKDYLLTYDYLEKMKKQIGAL